MTDITIPPEVEEAAARAAWGYEDTSAWERAMARKIIAAAINAWPGMTYERLRFTGDIGLILPLPQEARDE